LNYHSKPLGILNTRNFYDGLLTLTQHAKGEGFMDERQMALLKVSTNANDLLAQIYPNTRS
jgi:predicted Rossmann-fold nucleotide-binding protein